MLSDFFSGVGLLLRGFGFWRRRPGVMLLGLVPAAIVFALMLAALIALGANLPSLVVWLTPFDDAWPEPWPTIIASALGAVLLGGAIVLAAVTFTALTLAVGDPFYERIWRAAEQELGEVPEAGAGFWRAVRSSLALLGMGVLTALLVVLAGFVPLLGAALAPTLGIVLSGRLLAVELSSRAFEARGIPGAGQRALRRGIRWELLGFGVATQLLFMVPLGAVFTMPAAVAGSTFLAGRALDAARPAGRNTP
ncbi:EI24 domain-containing protein [Microterricola viridarii]|uniref:CysZ protein n=1 Tax=Microterricola viridarii TaxID=412690 RepID=A0A1H1Z9M2_9MICO|nr:EI24 domain-containing protein [Microterricola viridarii]SDT30471.1 CysZ protein [Microterricola viridarii]